MPQKPEHLPFSSIFSLLPYNPAMQRRLLTTLCGILISAVSAIAADQSAHIVLLHVNDIHGQTQGDTLNGKPVGGYARLSSAVDQIRKEVGPDHVLLIHAGDEFSRGDELTTLTHGKANIALMNQIGFNVWTPGNGEFYGGAANLQQRISEAHFPTLAANITYRLTGEHLAKDTWSTTVQGVRLSFLGLCFIHTEHPSSFVLKLHDTVETAKRLVPELRKNSDLVISIDHIGLTEDQKLAAAVPGIDIIVGGHSHTVLPKGTYIQDPAGHDTLIVQAGYHLHYLGRVDLDLDRVDNAWHLRSAKARLIPLDTRIPEDPAIKASIARMSQALPTQPASRPTRPQPAGID